MKISKLIIFGLLMCLFSKVYSQTETSTEPTSFIRPFGVGIHLEQFKIHDLGEYSENFPNKIVLTFSPSRFFRLEPEFGFNTDKHSSSGTDFKNRNMNMGVGVFGMTQSNRLNIYGGARSEYNIQKLKQTYSNRVQTTFVNIFTVGPALGCEYYLSDQVALGGEFAVKFATLSTDYEVDGQETEFDGDEDKKYTWTDTGLFLRFYF